MSRKIQHIINILAFNNGRTSGREGRENETEFYLFLSVPSKGTCQEAALGRENVAPVQIYAMLVQKPQKLWSNFVNSHAIYQKDDISEVNATRKANKWFVSIQVLETTLLSNSRTLKKAVVTCDVFNNDSNLRAVYQGTKKLLI